MIDIRPERTLDLKGVLCPNNFVNTKLELEDMQTGETLKLILDEGEPVKNVPRAVKDEGHEIIAVEKGEGCFNVLIRKT
jgi:TusA-related sulfurtransferase